MPSAVARYIDDLNRQGGLKGVDIANITDVSPPTVSRWAAGTHTPQPSAQRILADLHYVVQRLEEYYEPKDIRIWLHAPHPQLQGRRAIDEIQAGQSENVFAIIDRLDADVYI